MSKRCEVCVGALWNDRWQQFYGHEDLWVIRLPLCEFMFSCFFNETMSVCLWNRKLESNRKTREKCMVVPAAWIHTFLYFCFQLWDYLSSLCFHVILCVLYTLNTKHLSQMGILLGLFACPLLDLCTCTVGCGRSLVGKGHTSDVFFYSMCVRAPVSQHAFVSTAAANSSHQIR